MKIRVRVLVSFVLSLVLAGPAWAQGNSDVSGAVPMSDVSGSLSQSDLFSFQSDESRLRMGDVATGLVQGLRTGMLRPGMTGMEQTVVVPGTVVPLFLGSTREEARTAAQQLTDVLVAEGIPTVEATALARSAAGLLAEEGVVNPDRFLTTLHAFNAVVEAAPSSFLAQPPQAFVVVRAVLTTLLDATTS